jgi:chitin disaccharide deacetylase
MSNLIYPQHHRFIIINGDDFGFSTGVNQAIIQAHEQGILTSTSLMVTGDAVEEAVNLAKNHPNLGVGLHLVLVCGKSALPPSQIPQLVDGNGDFSDSPLQAGLRYYFNNAARNQLKQEIRAQLEKFRATGLPLSHVDGHLHLHMHPVVMGILVDLAKEFEIKFIRLPAEELKLNLQFDRGNLVTKIIWSIVFGKLRKYSENLLHAKGIGFAEKVYGLLQTANVDEKYLINLIPQIDADLVEIYSHPTDDSLLGKIELTALLSENVKKILVANGFKSVNFQDVN